MHIRSKKLLYFTAAFTLSLGTSFATVTPYIVTTGTDSNTTTGGQSAPYLDLRYALNQILNNQAQGLSNGPYAITFDFSDGSTQVTLENILPPINLFSSDTITIGNPSGSTTIDGNGHRPFFIRQGSNITLQNLAIENSTAQGGRGGVEGGGGGMGAGGAVFVDGATVTLSNVTFSSNSASAGRGVRFSGVGGGGGGGLGENGGATNGGLGGGGGYSGIGGTGQMGGGGGVANGGNGTASGAGAGGGGAILGASGGNSNAGNGQTVTGYVFGGGGAAPATATNGGAGGGTSPGAPATWAGGGGGYSGSGINGGAGGGGGGQGDSGSGGNGGAGGGGGGGGTNGLNSGSGGYGGGGGGGSLGGTGGFGGGGGGGGKMTSGSAQGNGGFGGGGGSCSLIGNGVISGNGGFGAGGGDGGGGLYTPGSGGTGGCNGLNTAGGDGGAMGGALFVNTGAVIFQGNCSATGNSVTANGGAGAFVGSDIFAVTGATLTFAPGTGNTVMLAGTIADDSLNSIPSGNSWQPGTGTGLSLTMQGPGTLVLSGANTYAGVTTVTAGRLSVNGSIQGGVSVASGATLGGTGTIYGGGSIFGTLSPGNSIGTITFDTSSGPLTLESSSITNIEIDPTTSSEILVTGSGSVALGGTVNVTQDAGSYPAGMQYTILEGSYTGEFDPAVTGGLPGYTFRLSYAPNFVYLLYGNIMPPQISTISLSGNSLKVANYLNNYASSSTIELFDGLSAGALQNAMERVSPSRNAFSAYITQQTAFSLSKDLSWHIDALITARERSSQKEFVAELFADASNQIQPPVKSLDKSKLSAWISGFGEYAHQKAEMQNPSFNYHSQAVLGGIDYCGENRGIAGIALGFVHTRYTEDHNFGHGNINGYVASLYGNAFAGNFYFSPAVWGIFNETENTRDISFSGFSKKAKANIFAWQLVPHLEVGYDVKFSWGDVIPFLAVDWAINWQRGYQERGSAPFNARAKALSNSMVRSEIGLKFCEKWERSWGVFFLREKVSYVFQKPFAADTVTTALTGIPTAFTVSALNQNLNLGDVGLDFAVAIGKKKPTSINLGYEAEFGSKYWSNQFMLTVGKDF